MQDIASHIRKVPDFPREGIVFYDITTLLKDAKAFRRSVDMMAGMLDGRDITSFAGPESRGFIFAAALSLKLGKGMIVTRKPGKLPHSTASVSYDLEYGSASLEIHEDAVSSESRVVVVDDLLATGGTARATGDLVERLGGAVTGYLFLIELEGLGGARSLAPHPVWSVLKMPG